MKPGQIITREIYGHPTKCRILKLHRMASGTIYAMDLERLSDGNCFRESGLWIEESR